MNCLLELFFKNSDLDANTFLSKRLLSSVKKSINYRDVTGGLDLSVWTTPERVVLNIKANDIVNYSKKGIKLSDKNEHMEHFLKKLKLNDTDSLTIRNNRYYYDYSISANEFFDEFYTKLVYILNESFSKNYKKLLLSLKNIYINISGNCKNILFNNIKSSNCTVIGETEYPVLSSEEYFELLEKNNIFLDPEKRINFVKNNLKIASDEFINNVLFIKEKPLFLYGKLKFDCNELFLQILTKMLKDKYTFFIKDDFLYFVFLSDTGVEKIDNFDDELYDGDIANSKYKINKTINRINYKINLYNRDKKSKEYKFIFNENRLTRLSKIAKFLSLWINDCSTEEIETILSSFIYKNSNFLKNNSELDLLIKKYFLTQNTKNELLINGVIDSLRPSKDSDMVPTMPTSIAISIANKLDTIVYCSILSELKRQTNKNLEKTAYNDLLKIIIKNNVDLPLKIIINYSIKNFINETISKKQDRLLIKKYKIDKNFLVNEILEKIYNKLYYYLINNDDCRGDIVGLLISSEIMSINNIKSRGHVLRVYNKIKSISSNCDDIQFLIKTYKRMNNLLNINKRFKILNNIYIILKPRKFANSYEKNLYDSYFKLKKSIKTLLVKGRYNVIMKDLHNMSININAFLDNVYINKINLFKRKRYIQLLFATKILYNKVMKFSNF